LGGIHPTDLSRYRFF